MRVARLFDLWRTDPVGFLEYQARQSFRSEKLLKGARLWASFVVTPSGETLFADLYTASLLGVIAADLPMVHRAGELDRAGEFVRFELRPVQDFAALSGRLVIDWGRGYLAWCQRADQQDKAILELRRDYQEERFPGFAELIFPLSAFSALPPSWVAVLRASRGIYLLTCPRTKEQYVGSATGSGRWSGSGRQPQTREGTHTSGLRPLERQQSRPNLRPRARATSGHGFQVTS